MPDGIDTRVQSVQSPGPERVVNRVAPHPCIDQLPPRHHPMLPLRKLDDPS